MPFLTNGPLIKSQNVDPTNRSIPIWPPRYEPLRHDDVRDLANQAATTLGSAMLTSQPGPLADAAWQAHIALSRVANLLDPNHDDRPGWINDLAARGDHIRAAAHRLLAAEQTPAQLAASTERDLQNVHDVGAVVLSAMLTIGLPDTHEITVEIATTDYRHPTPGWTTWHSDSLHLTGAVDGLAHLNRMRLTFLRHVYDRHGDRRDLEAAGRALAPVWPTVGHNGQPAPSTPTNAPPTPLRSVPDPNDESSTS